VCCAGCAREASGDAAMLMTGVFVMGRFGVRVERRSYFRSVEVVTLGAWIGLFYFKVGFQSFYIYWPKALYLLANGSVFTD